MGRRGAQPGGGIAVVAQRERGVVDGGGCGREGGDGVGC